MSGFVSGMIACLLLGLLFFPQSTGRMLHKAYNEVVVGWESVK